MKCRLKRKTQFCVPFYNLANKIFKYVKKIYKISYEESSIWKQCLSFKGRVLKNLTYLAFSMCATSLTETGLLHWTATNYDDECMSIAKPHGMWQMETDLKVFKNNYLWLHVICMFPIYLNQFTKTWRQKKIQFLTFLLTPGFSTKLCVIG